MDEQKQSLIDRIKQAQNILVTVSANPSVDQLSAAIGLTLALNKIDKHGTAVFSGQVPNTIDFLKPEETLEKNTDSLRDFIIALDKSKADKLRYKVEDEVVRIFITPYRTSLGEKDLEFSQGDFNVDVVVALGVTSQQDLDTAITAHGRILHDATVASVNNTGQTDLGTLNWVDPAASSLSEMVVTLVDGLSKKALDSQIATALLTGIVANTERFSNDKTTPKTMSASAELMAAGANQQLIANELENPQESPVSESGPLGNDTPVGDNAPAPVASQEDPGTLEIDHDASAEEEDETPEIKSEPEVPQPQVQVDENGQLLVEPTAPLPQISRVRGVGNDGLPTEAGNETKRERMTEPPKFSDGELTANTEPENEEAEASSEELTLPATDRPMLTHNERNLDEDANALPPAMLPPVAAPSPEPIFTPQDSEPELSPPPSFTPPTPVTPESESVFAPSTPSAQTSSVPESHTSPVPDLSLPPTPVSSDPVTLTPVVVEPTETKPMVSDDETLADIENSVHSPHLGMADTKPASDVDDARSAVEAALNNASSAATPDPIAALNAQPLGNALHDDVAPTAPALANTGFSESTPGTTPADGAMDMPLPSNPFGPGAPTNTVSPSSLGTLPGTPPPPGGQTPPPPVPPPMLPPLQ